LFDTYEDGSVSRWTGAEDSDNPASVIRVVSDGSQGGFGEAASHEAGGGGHHGAGMATEDLADTGGIDPILLYGVFSVGALALVGTGLVLLRTTRP
jgi:hypothetical protein